MLFVYCIETNKKIKNVVLPKSVVQHVNQYKNKDFKKTSLLAWSFLYSTLKTNFNIDLSKEKILFGSNKKPYIKSKKIYFNLSHSLNLIAIAISDKHVGVDIEKMVPAKICDLIASRILNSNELKKYRLIKNKSDYLTRLWTQKEAYTKMMGSSILKIKQLTKINTNNIASMQISDKSNNLYYLSFTNKK